jgi:hypothetical protein
MVYTVVVDSAGALDTTKAVLHGVQDARYERIFLEQLNKTVAFWPARIDECAVPALATLSFTVH